MQTIHKLSLKSPVRKFFLANIYLNRNIPSCAFILSTGIKKKWNGHSFGENGHVIENTNASLSQENLIAIAWVAK